MVFFDWKIFIENTENNMKKLKKKGFTQIETSTDCCEWYIGVSDYKEDWEETEKELEEFLDKKIDERIAFQNLIEKVFPNGYIEIWGNKKSPDDDLWKIFKGETYWDKYEEMKKWIRKEFKLFLEFVNDDLNGWFLNEWIVPTKLKKDVEKIKDFVS